MRGALCQVYLDRVDPVFKIIHRPSIREFMIEGKRYLDYEPPNVAPVALACTVCYAAASSLSDDECQLLFGRSKDDIMSLYCRLSERTLAIADVVTTNDVTVLQAYVLILVSCLAFPSSIPSSGYEWSLFFFFF